MPEESPQPAPKQVDTTNLLLIVVGAHLRAETADRPLAYALREGILHWLKDHQPALNIRVEPVVCTDLWYVNQEDLQSRPTISIGGPGVNALSQYYAQKLEPAMLQEHKMVIQLDPEFVHLRVAVWGMDHDLTVKALELFTERYLDAYLRAVVTQVEPDVG
ncbi:MAG: hypothetical protein GC164_16585 [Phycisphaera sp.]|nr:hypothetical protein [Phycisphaera sp.]